MGVLSITWTDERSDGENEVEAHGVKRRYRVRCIQLKHHSSSCLVREMIPLLLSFVHISSSELQPGF